MSEETLLSAFIGALLAVIGFVGLSSGVVLGMKRRGHNGRHRLALLLAGVTTTALGLWLLYANS